MKHRSMKLAGPVLVVAAVGTILWVNAGSLTPPPGAITATHETPISASTTPGDADSLFKITQPGSYYLRGNITGMAALHGIEIAADGVTLDLRGFTLFGVGGSLSGIYMPFFQVNVVIQNGHVRDWAQHGVDAAIDIGRIERITAAFNGGWGIRNNNLGTYTSHILACEAFSNGAGAGAGGGLEAAAHARISDCIAFTNTGDGIAADAFSVVEGCTSSENTDDGIVLSTHGTVRRCLVSENDEDGIQVTDDCLVTENSCASNGIVSAGAGIRVIGIDNRIDGNQLNDNDTGINVSGTGNLIVRNTAAENTVNYTIAVANTSAAIAGGGGVGFLNDQPWANWSY